MTADVLEITTEAYPVLSVLPTSDLLAVSARLEEEPTLHQSLMAELDRSYPALKEVWHARRYVLGGWDSWVVVVG